MKRTISIGCLVAACGAFVLTTCDCAWWLLLGKRGRAFASELDWYFADEHARLLAILDQGQVAGEQAAT